MRATNLTIMRTFGGVLGLAVVLAAALSYMETGAPPRDHVTAAATSLVLPAAAGPAADQAPTYVIVDWRDLSAGSRRRISAEIMVDGAYTPHQVRRALGAAAEALRAANGHLGAVMISAYAADAGSDTWLQRVAWMVWSPDGRGWDATAQDDFCKHFFSEPDPER